MRCLLSLFLMSVVLFSAASFADQDYAVGATQGELQVDRLGAVNYRIPLTMPPGIAGFHPKLALVYRSGTGHGIAGGSWQLEGLTQIHRCLGIPALHEQYRVITFSDKDIFCIDGHFLSEVSKREFHTVSESFSRIERVNAGFSMLTKTGIRIHYGSEAGARMHAISNTQQVLSWLVDRMQDPHGNSIEYLYSQEPAERLIKEIRYATSRLEFNYEPRHRTITQYLSGVKKTLSQRLARIRLLTDDLVVREYRFNYHPPSPWLQDHLAGITECVSVPIEEWECLRPTVFDWGEMDQSIVESNDYLKWDFDWLQADKLPQRYHSGDFNGDGLSDIYYFGFKDHALQQDKIYFGSTEHQFDEQVLVPTIQVTAEDLGNIRIGDFNGDGLSDFYHFRYRSAHDSIYLARMQGSQLVFDTVQGIDSGTARRPSFGRQCVHLACLRLADFNGDGKTDVYHIQAGQDYLYLTQNAGEYIESLGVESFASNFSLTEKVLSRIRIGDFNGDRRVDIYRINVQAQDEIFLYLGDAEYKKIAGIDSFLDSKANRIIELMRIQFGDFNADRLEDIYYAAPDGSNYVYLSQGDGIYTQKQAPEFPDVSQSWHQIASRLQLLDLNGDHATDIHYFNNSGAPNLFWSLSGDQWQVFTARFGNVDEDSIRTAGRGWLDVNGDGAMDLYELSPRDHAYAHVYLGTYKPPLLTHISNGLGLEQHLVYQPLPSVYTPVLDSTDWGPEIVSNRGFPLWVVTEQQRAGEVIERYQYAGSQLHRGGLGFLGFLKTYREDLVRGIKEQMEYALNYPHSGKLLSETQWLNYKTSAPTVIRKKHMVYESHALYKGKTHVSFLQEARQVEYDLQGKLVTSTTEAYRDYDAYGDARRIVKTIKQDTQEFVETTEKQFIAHAVEDTIRLLQRQAITYSDGVHADITQVSVLAYGGGHLPIQKTIQPGHSLSLTQTYRYDPFGNLIYFSNSPSEEDQDKRETHTKYDEQGQYIIERTNAQGHRQKWFYKAGEMFPGRILDANQREQSNQYDAWGRLIQRVDFDGNVLIRSYNQPDSVLKHPDSVYVVREQIQGKPIREIYYDQHQRRVREVVHGLNQEKIIRDYRYDPVGRLLATSLPFSDKAAPKVWTFRAYDARDRMTEERTPYPGRHVSFTVQYDGNMEHRQNRLGQVQTIERDAPGRIVRIVDTQGNQNDFDYDPLGNLLKISSAEGAVTEMEYDVFGNRLVLHSPHLGNWQYTYDAFAQKKSETSESVHRVFHYDLLGRMIRRVEGNQVASWTYDTAPNGIGRLAVEQFRDYRQSYAYDPRGRLIQVQDGAYITKRHYNQFNQVVRIDYPGQFSVERNYSPEGYLESLYLHRAVLSALPRSLSHPENQGKAGSSRRFQKQREYKMRLDFYYSLLEGRHFSSQLIQDLKVSVDELAADLLQLQTMPQEAFNTYSWALCRDVVLEKIEEAESLLVVTQASRHNATQLRTMLADQLLKEAEVYLPCTGQKKVQEASQQAIVQQPSMRIELWRALQRDEFGVVTNMRYGNAWETRRDYNTTRQPISIHTLDHNKATVRSLSYAYDELGNIVDRSDKKNLVDEYFEYDELNRLSQAILIDRGHKQSLREVYYQYDAQGNVLKRSGVGTYWYANLDAPQQVSQINKNIYQYDVMGNLVAAPNFSAQWRSGNKPIRFKQGHNAVVHHYDANNRIVSRSFSTGKVVHRAGDLYDEIHDPTGIYRCGKIYAGRVPVAMYCVHNNQTEQLYYLHRDVLGSIDTVSNEQGQLLARFEYDPFGKRRYHYGQLPIDLGYTGHEHYEEFGLIDMKGRFYDPHRGQFLSPDPQIPSPLNIQSYHRYSYAMNNPLRYTDPSGFFFKKIIKKIGSLFRQPVKLIKQNFRVIVATAAGYYAGFLAADSFVQAASKQLIWSPGAMASGAYMQAYQNILFNGVIASGISAAAVTSALTGGKLSQILLQGLSGGLTCAAGTCFSGKILTPERIATSAALNGVTAMANGGSFKNAALAGLAGGTLRAIALQMRSQQIAQSMLNPDNAGGLSAGLYGDHFKLGGIRQSYGDESSSLLGGIQGGQGQLFGQSYAPGTWQDHLVEAFAGPHDYLNSWYWYDQAGNISPKLSPLARWLGDGINITNLFLSAPFVVASRTPSYFYSLPH